MKARVHEDYLQIVKAILHKFYTYNVGGGGYYDILSIVS